ncbi:MAG TPA: hypothetical protein VHB50_10355, partial [Bryobacteraceae bacterium]|nr:hypothetical protein [Bryobacteraceae bacterium]
MGRRVAEGLLGFLIALPAIAQIQITAVTTSAGFVPGLPAYGGLCTIFVSGLTGINGVVTAQSLPLPVSLAGVQVYFGNLAAPLYGVASLNGYQQINIQVPYESSIFSITVSQGSAVSSPVTPSFDAAPGEFFQDADGRAIV